MVELLDLSHTKTKCIGAVTPEVRYPIPTSLYHARSLRTGVSDSIGSLDGAVRGFVFSLAGV